MTTRWMNVALIMLFIFLIFLQYQLWFESGGIRDMLKLKHQLNSQLITNEKLKNNNDELTFQIARSQHSKDATEARARNELGMIKKDETFYQFVH